MRTTSFVSFSQKYAAAMAGRNIPVTFGGTDAWTDNERIHLPALPAGTMLTPWETKVMTGYLDHEIGHLLYTDWRQLRIVQPRPGDPQFQEKLIVAYLENVFEDVRMENDSIREMPPVKPYLDAVEQQQQYDHLEGKGGPKPTAGGEILSAIYLEAYIQYRDPDVTYQPIPRLDQYPQLAPIKEAMKELDRITTTREAMDLARRVYDLLPKDIDYRAPPRDLILTMSGPDGTGEITIILPGVEENKDGTPNISLEAINQAFVLTHKPSAMTKLLDRIKEGNRPKNHPDNGHLILPPYDTAEDKIFVPSEKDHATADHVRRHASAEITAAKKMLTIALQARTKKAWEKGLPDGTLDEEALPDLLTGDTDLFKDRRPTTAVDTALQLMLDLSSSMRSENTRLAGIILAEALHSIPRLKLSIAGFRTGNLVAAQGARRPFTGTGRTTSLLIPMFKDFKEPYLSARDRLGALTSEGGTPLGEAYALGFERLLQRKEPKRVLWLVTDGEPAVQVGDKRHSEYALMEKTFHRCRDHGIKTVILNIGPIDPRGSTYADTAHSIKHHRELPAALIKIAKEIRL